MSPLVYCRQNIQVPHVRSKKPLSPLCVVLLLIFFLFWEVWLLFLLNYALLTELQGGLQGEVSWNKSASLFNVSIKSGPRKETQFQRCSWGEYFQAGLDEGKRMVTVWQGTTGTWGWGNLPARKWCGLVWFCLSRIISVSSLWPRGTTSLYGRQTCWFLKSLSLCYSCVLWWDSLPSLTDGMGLLILMVGTLCFYTAAVNVHLKAPAEVISGS